MFNSILWYCHNAYSEDVEDYWCWDQAHYNQQTVGDSHPQCILPWLFPARLKVHQVNACSKLFGMFWQIYLTFFLHLDVVTLHATITDEKQTQKQHTSSSCIGSAACISITLLKGNEDLSKDKQSFVVFCCWMRTY